MDYLFLHIANKDYKTLREIEQRPTRFIMKLLLETFVSLNFFSFPALRQDKQYNGHLTIEVEIEQNEYCQTQLKTSDPHNHQKIQCYCIEQVFSTTTYICFLLEGISATFLFGQFYTNSIL